MASAAFHCELAWLGGEAPARDVLVETSDGVITAITPGSPIVGDATRLAGIVLPALPGHMLILGGLIVAAWADGFRHVSGWTLGLIAVIALASYGIDFVSAAVSTRKLGASRRAMAGAAIGTLGGLFFGLPGLIAGPFVGAVIGSSAAVTGYTE